MALYKSDQLCRYLTLLPDQRACIIVCRYLTLQLDQRAAAGVGEEGEQREGELLHDGEHQQVPGGVHSVRAAEGGPVPHSRPLREDQHDPGRLHAARARQGGECSSLMFSVA